MSQFSFTSNDEVAILEDDDDMAQFVGYVTKWGGQEVSKKGARVARMLLSNNEGTNIQVTAWTSQIPKIESVAVMDSVVEIDGAKVINLTGKQKYNFGNVNKELRIVAHTEVKKLGVLKKNEQKNDVQSVTLKTISRYVGHVKLEATLFNTIQMMNIKGSCYGIGSIIDESTKLEIKVYKITNCNKYMIGQRLQLEGKLHKRTIPESDIPAPAYFEVEDESKIKIINRECKLIAGDLVKAYAYVKMT